MPAEGKNAVVVGIGGNIKDQGIVFNNKYGDQVVGFGAWSYRLNTQDVASKLANGLNDNNWHHLVSTLNQDSLIFYVDGVKYGSDFMGDKPGFSGTNNGFYLGCRHLNSSFFNGAIDDVRVWKRALGGSEVTQLFNSTATQISQLNNLVNSISIFPNPCIDNFRISSDFNLEGAQIYLINSIGAIVYSTKLDRRMNISTNGISKGIYSIIIKHEFFSEYRCSKLLIN